MKKYLLLILLPLINTNFLVAQTNVYFPFSETNAEWRTECIHDEGFGNNYYWHPNRYANGQDTVIESTTYKKLFTSVLGEGTNLKGYRNDIPNKKVYAYTVGDFTGDPPREILLYDFSLMVGDTFKAWPIVDCDSISIVTGYDSALVGNSYRQKINFSGLNGNIVSIIQGIGSLGGLYEYQWCFEQGCGLCTYSDDSINFVGNAFCTTGIIENVPRTPLKITPNPFTTYTTLSTDVHLKNARLDLYNSYGKLVKSVKNISGQTYTLQRENIPSGIYFIRLIEDNKIISSEKIIAN